MIDGLLWRDAGTFAGSAADTGALIEGMLRHNAEVQRAIAPERLLVWNLTEGWEPLCEFLELPVPDVPLPHINDRSEFLNRIVDGSMDALLAWRSQQATVDAAFALKG
jgi:hypothetical protein